MKLLIKINKYIEDMSLDIEINSKIRLDNQSRLKEMNKKGIVEEVKKKN